MDLQGNSDVINAKQINVHSEEDEGGTLNNSSNHALNSSKVRNEDSNDKTKENIEDDVGQKDRSLKTTKNHVQKRNSAVRDKVVEKLERRKKTIIGKRQDDKSVKKNKLDTKKKRKPGKNESPEKQTSVNIKPTGKHEVLKTQNSPRKASEIGHRRKATTHHKSQKDRSTKTVYRERQSKEIQLRIRRESRRETGSSLIVLNDPILEESEESLDDTSDEIFDSPDFKPVTSVIVSPRQDEINQPRDLNPQTVKDPRNGGESCNVEEEEEEEDRISYKTNFFSPDLYSRDGDEEVFHSDFEPELRTDDFNMEIKKKKKKKKSKKMKKLEKKERAKRRRAELLYQKIRGYADSIYEHESLTISIKSERKIKLDRYIPERVGNKRYRMNKRKLASTIKKVQQTLDTFKKKQQDIQENLKKLESKKDKDAKPIMETLYEQLRETEQLYQQALHELKDVQEDLGKKLGKKEEKPEPQEASRSAGSPSRKINLSPDEQELTYELKAQLMRNIEMQNQKLKTELTLHEKMNESKLLNQQNRKLHEDSTMSRTNTLRLMKMFEKKAKDADDRLKEMQRELHKSQQLTKKYQQLLELEKRKLGGSSGHVTPVSTGDEGESPRVPHPSSYSLLGGNVRVNDIIRKNEVLIEENGNLRREIQRLKQDNATLIKKTKHAMTDKDEIIKRIQTLCAENAKMQHQLSKERSQHNMLSRSLTRQASDWIMLKKQLAQFDEEYKWSQVKTQKEEADQRFGRLPPIYTVGPLTPITEVSSELSTPVNSSISYYEMDLPADADYELHQFHNITECKLSAVVNARTRTPKSHYGSTAYLPSRATNKEGKSSADWTSVYKMPPRQRSVMEMSEASTKNPREYSMLSEYVKVPKPPKREKSKLLPII